jgi:hypothetical protein
VELVKLAEEMRAYAKDHAYNLASGDLAPDGAYRIVKYKGVEVNVVFTLDILSDKMEAWHLSLGGDGDRQLPDAIVDEFVVAFFGTTKPTQIPEILENQVQFIEYLPK